MWTEIDYKQEREIERVCLHTSMTYTAVRAAGASKGGPKAIEAALKKLRGE